MSEGEELDGRIASAMAALHGARAAANRNPSARNLAVETMAETALDELLDAKLEQRAAVR